MILLRSIVKDSCLNKDIGALFCGFASIASITWLSFLDMVCVSLQIHITCDCFLLPDYLTVRNGVLLTRPWPEEIGAGRASSPRFKHKNRCRAAVAPC